MTMKHVTQWPPTKVPHRGWNLFHLLFYSFSININNSSLAMAKAAFFWQCLPHV